GSAVAHCVEQWSGRPGPTDQRFRIGEHDWVVPRALHNEWQLKRRRARLGRCYESSGALQIELARRDRCRANERQNDCRALDFDLLGCNCALIDLQRDRDLVIRCASTTEFAATRKGPPL